MKKFFAMILTALMLVFAVVPTMAATNSADAKVTSVKVTVSTDSYTYNGKTFTPKYTVKATINGKTVDVTNDSKLIISGTKSAKNAGSYKITATYGGKNATVKWTVNKAANTAFTTKTGKVQVVMGSAIKANASSFTVKSVNATGTVKVTTNSKYLSVSGSKVTVKKGTPAGSYAYYVTDSGSNNVKARTYTKYVTVARSENPTTISFNKSRSLKSATVKKSAVTITVKTANKQGKMTVTSNSKYVTVNGSKITVKKGTPKGTYKITVKFAKTSYYKGLTKTFNIKVK